MAEMKRFWDIVLGSVFLLLTAPLMAVLAVLILLDSGRPALFVQERIGLHGRIFRMLKFRSMRTGEYERTQTFSSTSPDEPVFYDPNVSRYVTRVGRYLRMSSLDELPQLVNVIRGDMSLVGPRPVLPADMVLYGDQAEKRCSVRPGITGLYQISGRKTLPLKTAIRLDLEYVDRQSVLYDLWILLRTPLALLNAEDAN
jgi:lipopolysaccharide/colanic/teichoic acid biosynthesis glycosyltransferase